MDRMNDYLNVAVENLDLLKTRLIRLGMFDYARVIDSQKGTLIGFQLLVNKTKVNLPKGEKG